MLDGIVVKVSLTMDNNHVHSSDVNRIWLLMVNIGSAESNVTLCNVWLRNCIKIVELNVNFELQNANKTTDSGLVDKTKSNEGIRMYYTSKIEELQV
jgi:hypothetical protein